MKQEIAELWAQALESGEYKQGTGRLRNGDQFCCLGVLSDLHCRSTKSTWTLGVSTVDSNIYYCYKGLSFHLPDEVKEWAEIVSHRSSPKVRMRDGTYEFFSHLNDDKEKTFPDSFFFDR